MGSAIDDGDLATTDATRATIEARARARGDEDEICVSSV